MHTTSSPPSGLAVDIKQGQAVKYVYVRDTKVCDALITVVCGELGYPLLSVVLVLPGNRGTTVKTFVPHRTLWRLGDPGYWMMPDDVPLVMEDGHAGQ